MLVPHAQQRIQAHSPIPSESFFAHAPRRPPARRPTFTHCPAAHPPILCRLQLSLADFELLRRVGDGSYSHVVLARHRSTGREYALKVVDKQYILR